MPTRFPSCIARAKRLTVVLGPRRRRAPVSGCREGAAETADAVQLLLGPRIERPLRPISRTLPFPRTSHSPSDHLFMGARRCRAARAMPFVAFSRGPARVSPARFHGLVVQALDSRLTRRPRRWTGMPSSGQNHQTRQRTRDQPAPPAEHPRASTVRPVHATDDRMLAQLLSADPPRPPIIRSANEISRQKAPR